MAGFLRALTSEAVTASVLSTALWIAILRPMARRWSGRAVVSGKWWLSFCVVVAGGLVQAVVMNASNWNLLQTSTILNPTYLEATGITWGYWLCLSLIALTVNLHLKTIEEPGLFLLFVVAMLFGIWFIPYRILALFGMWSPRNFFWYLLVTLLPLFPAIVFLTIRRVRWRVARFALVVILLVLSEPIAFIGTSIATFASRDTRLLLRSGPGLLTAEDVGLDTDCPDDPARIVRQEVFGLFRIVDVAAWGGCFRILQIRTGFGWKSVHSMCFCE